jgi:hypothetical protein
MDKIFGMMNKTTTFPADGSVVETGDGWSRTSVFPADGSVNETLRLTTEDGSIQVIVKKTTFPENGSVVETITQSYIE